MNFEKNVNRVLHDEHMEVTSLLNRFDGLLVNVDAERGLDVAEPETARLLSEVAAALEGHIDRHFRFEEEALFPELEEAGEGDFVEALREDHANLVPMARRVAVLLKRALANDLSGDEWLKLARLGRVYVGDLTAHAEREEMALLPLLELHLDDDRDVLLWQDYALGETSTLAAEQ